MKTFREFLDEAAIPQELRSHKEAAKFLDTLMDMSTSNALSKYV